MLLINNLVLSFDPFFVFSWVGKMEEEELEQFNDFFEGLNDIRETANDLSDIRRLGRVPRIVFRDQENPLEALREKEFKENLIFSKDGFLHILELFKDKIRRPCHQSAEISPLLKLTVYLQYVRSNDFYKSTRILKGHWVQSSPKCDVSLSCRWSKKFLWGDAPS